MSDLDTARRLAELRSHRNAIIEECARVADSYAAPNYSGSTPEHIARAIRALKDKQP